MNSTGCAFVSHFSCFHKKTQFKLPTFFDSILYRPLSNEIQTDLIFQHFNTSSQDPSQHTHTMEISVQQDSTFWALILSSFVYLISVAHLRHTVLPKHGQKLKSRLQHLPLIYYGFFFGCYATIAITIILTTNFGLDTLRCNSSGSIESCTNNKVCGDQIWTHLRHELPRYVVNALLALAPIHHVDTVFLMLNQPQEFTTSHLLERLLVPFRLYFDLILHPYGFGLLFSLLYSILCSFRYLWLAHASLAQSEVLRPLDNRSPVIRNHQRPLLEPTIHSQGQVLAYLQLLINSFVFLHSLYSLQSNCQTAIGLQQLHAIFGLVLFLSTWSNFKDKFSQMQRQPSHQTDKNQNIIGHPNHNVINAGSTVAKDKKEFTNGYANGSTYFSTYQPVCNDIYRRFG